jgi:atypical dual specificity phosphatase
VTSARAAVRGLLHALGVVDDLGAWIPLDAGPPAHALGASDTRLRACAYPRTARALAGLAADGITVLVNTERAHPAPRLAAHGLREVHVPIRDFGVPTADQIDRVVAALDQALAGGERVAVHCGAGLGRTGTLLACYLVARGLPADAAVARIRQARPGAIETAAQLEAVYAYAARRGERGQE